MTRSEALRPLSHDHYEGLQFAARLRRDLRADAAPSSLAADVVAFWRAHLVPHFEEEEVAIVPVLRGGAEPLVGRMLREHAEIEALVRRTEAEPDAETLAGFAEALVAHIRFEEREAFPAAERLADAEALEQIRRRLERARSGR